MLSRLLAAGALLLSTGLRLWFLRPGQSGLILPEIPGVDVPSLSKVEVPELPLETDLQLPQLPLELDDGRARAPLLHEAQDRVIAARDVLLK